MNANSSASKGKVKARNNWTCPVPIHVWVFNILQPKTSSKDLVRWMDDDEGFKSPDQCKRFPWLPALC